MTTEELKQLLNALEAKSKQQAPYFDDRVLQQIENVKNILKTRRNDNEQKTFCS